MQLPDSIILDIIRGARGAAGLAGDAGAESAGTGAAPAEGSATPERRRARRAGVGSSIPFTRYGAIGAAAREAGFRDISAGGIGMLLGESILAPGEQVVLHPRRAWRDEGSSRVAPGDAAGETLNLLCTVRTVRVRRDGAVNVGVEFTASGERALLDHVTSVRATVGGAVRFGDERRAPPAGPTVGDGTTSRLELCGQNCTRSGERQALRARAAMYVYGADTGEASPEYVEVRDYSAGGVRVVRAGALAVGDQFVIRVPMFDEDPVTRLCSVTRVVRAADRWDIGARFIPFSQRRGRSWLARLADWIA